VILIVKIFSGSRPPCLLIVTAHAHREPGTNVPSPGLKFYPDEFHKRTRSCHRGSCTLTFNCLPRHTLIEIHHWKDGVSVCISVEQKLC